LYFSVQGHAADENLFCSLFFKKPLHIQKVFASKNAKGLEQLKATTALVTLVSGRCVIEMFLLSANPNK